ncbi:PLAC8 family-domain-containing protein [Gloeopeniophorella convolvens]|nr:PLAC8 family-domain-containing protein [Gloeopeniophorella convolvens]
MSNVHSAEKNQQPPASTPSQQSQILSFPAPTHYPSGASPHQNSDHYNPYLDAPPVPQNPPPPSVQHSAHYEKGFMMKQPMSTSPRPLSSPQAFPPSPMDPPGSHQPQPTNPMMPTAGGGGRKNVHDVPVQSDGLREWSFGLFNCLGDLPTCCRALLCPCVVYGDNKQRYEHLQAHGVPRRERGKFFNDDCLAHGVLDCFCNGWVLQIASRADVRRRYSIRGDPLHDCLASCSCTACELVQEHREIELEVNSLRNQGYNP